MTGTLVAAALVGACGPSAPSTEFEEIEVAAVDTIFSPGGEELGLPVDLAVDAFGRLWILDQAMHRILRVGAEGEVSAFGRPGKGPGELSAPLAIGVGEDAVRVDDRGNGRILTLDTAGVQAASFPLPPGLPGSASFGASGTVAVATLGFAAEGLVRVLDRDGAPLAYLGEPVVTGTPIWNFTAMKEEVRRGRVPDVLRNHALPVLAPDGGAWIVLGAEAEVRRYAPDGVLRWTRTVSTPEVDAIREQFFVRNRAEDSPFTFHGLQYFADAVEVEGELWLLVASPEEEGGAVVILDGEGEVARRYTLPGVHGARSLAVDPDGRRVYLAVPSDAAVLSFVLPPR